MSCSSAGWRGGTRRASPEPSTPARSSRYQPGWTPERALALLQDESGTGYDPAVVEALERLVTPTDDGPSWVADLAAPARSPITRPVFPRA